MCSNSCITICCYANAATVFYKFFTLTDLIYILALFKCKDVMLNKKDWIVL